MTSRANFLKTLVAGIAAAPVVASTKTHEHVKAPAMPGKWREKHWKKGELHFSEYVLPITMASHFEEVRKDRPLHRMITIPMFDREVVDAPFSKIVDSMIESNTRRTRNMKRHGMPVVDENGNSIDYGSSEEATNFITVIKIEGHPTLMGIGLTEYKLMPVRDYYRDVAARNKRVKGMSTVLDADRDELGPTHQPLSYKEEVAREEGRVGKTNMKGGLRTL